MARAPTLELGLPSAGFAADVAEGLTRRGQKTLPCKYFYDQVGSILFEAICALPEYGLTAADARLLRAHAEAMVSPFAADLMVAELGSGSGQKTRWILEALCRRQFTLYSPIEISPMALQRCQNHLSNIGGLEIMPLQAEYLDGLESIAQRRNLGRMRGRPLLVLFLGSTLGNFEPDAAQGFLASIRRLLRPGDGLLLGVDLVKPATALRRAYDDPTGVTAAFNLNLLARLNRELGTDFDLRQWQHWARYRRREQQVEMHLRSRREQRVRLPPSTIVSFRRGETIWTESSRKFRSSEIGGLISSAGFRLHRQWRDAEWGFAENLCLVVEA